MESWGGGFFEFITETTTTTTTSFVERGGTEALFLDLCGTFIFKYFIFYLGLNKKIVEERLFGVHPARERKRGRPD